MFRLFRKDEDPGANRLSDEAEPNTLSWTDGDAPDEDDSDTAGEGDDREQRDEGSAEREKLDLDAELAREAEEFGLTGNDPVQLYGPHGEDVASVVEALNDIDDDDADAIADAYDAVSAADRKVAQSIVGRLRRDRGLESEMWAAEQAVEDWLAGIDENDEMLDTLGVVADAAKDAVDALILEDELADVDFATLYGPWSDVMDTDEDETEGEETAGEETGAEEGAASGDATTGDATTGEAGSDEGAEDEGAEDEGAEDEGAEDEGEFGPNTDLVDQLFGRLSAITPAEAAALVTTWRAQPKEDLRLAHRDLQQIADEDKTWRRQLQKAQDEVLSWINGDSTRIVSRLVPATQGGSREVVGPVVADAVSALVMADMLEGDDAETLYRPWAQVIKEPALPEYEEDDSGGDEDDGEEDGGEEDER